MNPHTSAETVELIRADAINARSTSSLWKYFLPAGKLSLLAGPPGTGKTTVALALAATLTRGHTWPDGSVATPAKVLIWSGEDSKSETLVPRLTADQNEIMAAAECAGFKPRSVQRARVALGIQARQSGFGAKKRSHWALPAASVPIMPSEVAGTDGTDEAGGAAPREEAHPS